VNSHSRESFVNFYNHLRWNPVLSCIFELSQSRLCQEWLGMMVSRSSSRRINKISVESEKLANLTQRQVAATSIHGKRVFSKIDTVYQNNNDISTVRTHTTHAIKFQVTIPVLDYEHISLINEAITESLFENKNTGFFRIMLIFLFYSRYLILRLAAFWLSWKTEALQVSCSQKNLRFSVKTINCIPKSKTEQLPQIQFFFSTSQKSMTVQNYLQRDLERKLPFTVCINFWIHFQNLSLWLILRSAQHIFKYFARNQRW